MTPTPTEIIADRIAGVCTVDPADVAAAIVTRLEREGWVIRRRQMCSLEGRPRHGDRWETRDGMAVVVASNDWPPPQPGTHESDLLDRRGAWPAYDLTQTAERYSVYFHEHAKALRWSRQNNPERNPQ